MHGMLASGPASGPASMPVSGPTSGTSSPVFAPHPTSPIATSAPHRPSRTSVLAVTVKGSGTRAVAGRVMNKDLAPSAT